MLQVSSVIGLERLGNWKKAKVFTPRGRYERADPMAGVGRLADWVECSCLFGADGTVAKTDIIDELVDSGVLAATTSDTVEDVAELIVDEVYTEIRRRSRLMTGTGPFSFPFSVTQSVVRRTVADWTAVKTYGFLLLTSMGHLAQWLRTQGTSQHEVGHLFEDLVRHCAEGLFGRPSSILETSRKGDNALKDRVRALLVPFAREIAGGIGSAPARIRDGGLDVVIRLWNDTDDIRPGGAHFLVQCATGGDWETKILHPVLAKWREWVDWRGPVYKAFAVPFLFVDDARLHDASRDGEWTLVLDRSRLLYGLRQAGTFPADLETHMADWCGERLPFLHREGLVPAS